VNCCRFQVEIYFKSFNIAGILNFSFEFRPGWLLDYLTTHTSLSPIRRGFAPGFENYKKGSIRLAAASDKVYQLLAHGRWFSPDTPASSTTKTGHHDIAEILLKVALNTNKSNQIKFIWICSCFHIIDYYRTHYNQLVWTLTNIC
jgi:hypothetical protein